MKRERLFHADNQQQVSNSIRRSSLSTTKRLDEFADVWYPSRDIECPLSRAPHLVDPGLSGANRA